MMNIYKHEFKSSFRSVITWSLSLSAIIFLFMATFPTFADEAETLNEMMSNFPEELLMAFGMTGLDMSTVLGFYGLIFLFCQLILAVQASNIGFGLVSVEERELTADFLLAKPVGRAKILTSKLLSAISGLMITNLVVWISSFVFIEIFRDGRAYESKPLVILLLGIFVFQLTFMSIGMFISLMVKRIRSVTPYSMGLTFGMYLMSAFGGLIGGSTLDVITPFKHFEPNYIISNAAYDMPLALVSVAFIVISVVGSYVLYQKRNIPTPI